ncbi:HdeD family acid-resistance protein [Streptomyces lavendulocolor]|uniref:HdeD family acid-resistance protein n=1 Tax=Streptomyces lavendulocolor TaxID=67316 RepID=UPI0033C7D725
MSAPHGPESRTGREHRPGATAPGGTGGGPLGDPGDPGDPGGPAGPSGDTAGVYALARLGGSWPWLLGSAVATLVPGVLVLVWPEATLHVLAVLIGLYLLVNGAFRFVAAFSRKGHDRLPGLLLAVLYVLAGVLCLRNPLQTIAALSLVVGAVWLVSGILTLYAALTTENLPHRGVVLGVAVLGIVAGVVVLAVPTESARALTRLLGLWLVLLGLAEAVAALAWRSALTRTRASGPHPPTPATRHV